MACTIFLLLTAMGLHYSFFPSHDTSYHITNRSTTRMDALGYILLPNDRPLLLAFKASEHDGSGTKRFVTTVARIWPIAGCASRVGLSSESSSPLLLTVVVLRAASLAARYPPWWTKGRCWKNLWKTHDCWGRTKTCQTLTTRKQDSVRRTINRIAEPVVTPLPKPSNRIERRYSTTRTFYYTFPHFAFTANHCCYDYSSQSAS